MPTLVTLLSCVCPCPWLARGRVGGSEGSAWRARGGAGLARAAAGACLLSRKMVIIDMVDPHWCFGRVWDAFSIIAGAGSASRECSRSQAAPRGQLSQALFQPSRSIPVIGLVLLLLVLVVAVLVVVIVLLPVAVAVLVVVIVLLNGIAHAERQTHATLAERVCTTRARFVAQHRGAQPLNWPCAPAPRSKKSPQCMGQESVHHWHGLWRRLHGELLS